MKLKNNQTKYIFYLKSKLNQDCVIALFDLHVLRRISENEILHPITY